MLKNELVRFFLCVCVSFSFVFVAMSLFDAATPQ